MRLRAFTAWGRSRTGNQASVYLRLICASQRSQALQQSSPKPGAHNLFAIAGSTTFIFMNCGRQSVQAVFTFWNYFCSACTRLFWRYPYTVDAEFLLRHG